MDNPAWNDAQLVQASRQGNQRAFAALVHRYKGLVSALAYSSTCDPILSQELAQETFTVAWRKLNQITDAEKFRPWVCGIVRHLIQQALRDRQRSAGQAVQARRSARDNPSPQPTPCDAAVAREQSETVAKALAQLPEEYRLPLVLYYYEGRSSRTVAEALGLSDDAVRQRLVRGRERLREELLKLVDNTLERQRPKQAFVVAVLAGLSKGPAATVGIAKWTFSTATLESAVAAGGIVAALLVMFAMLGSSGKVAAKYPSVTPVEAPPVATAAAAQTPEEPPASAEPVVPAPAVAETPPATPPPPPPPNTDAEDSALAASILDRAWETWKGRPQYSTAIFCVDAWGFRAALGDAQCRARLLREACDPNSGAWGPRSNQTLIAVLDDREYLEGIYDRCADVRIPMLDRLGHYASLYWSIDFLCAGGRQIPPSATDAAVAIVEAVGPHKTVMDILEKTATERARPMAEYYLLASLADGPVRTPSGGGFRARGNAGGMDAYYGGHCLAARCLAILERIGNPAAGDAVREYLPRASQVDAVHAASVLCRLGGRDEGLAVLKEILGNTGDPGVRIACLSSLVKAGAREYLGSLRQDALSGDANLRLGAYCALGGLNDPWFAGRATRDFERYWDSGFWEILGACPETWQATPSGIRAFRNDACTAYCLALANCPEAIRSEDKVGALMEQLAINALQDSPQAPRALSACMPALTTPMPAADTGAFRHSWVGRLVFLIHWGDAQTRQRAAECLTEAYRRDPDTARWIARKLINASNPEALPLAVEIMKTSPLEEMRVCAAGAYFSIKAGKRWFVS